MNINKKEFIAGMATIFLGVWAQISFAAPTTFSGLINDLIIGSIIRPIVPLLIGLAVVVFIYGVFKYIFAKGGEDKEDGKSFMLWGIIGLFVMVSLWGFVSILTETFNLNNVPQTIQLQAPKL